MMSRAAADREKTATDYKSEKMKEMEAEGYKILGNSGDQWSDLLGYSMSARSFKLPNPMYYIPCRNRSNMIGGHSVRYAVLIYLLRS